MPLIPPPSTGGTSRGATPGAAGRTALGFTLVELLLALVLASIVATALLTVLTGQQRFYAGAAQLIETRTQLRDATAILPHDLRNASPAAGDLLALGDSAIELRATIATAVACDVGPRTLDLPPLDSGANPLTAWWSRPDAGDEVHVLDDVTGHFHTYQVLAVGTSAGWCRDTPFASPTGDAGATRYRVTVARALAPGVRRGSPMRFTRRVRYALYRSPADGDWYLGNADFNPALGTFNTIQPLSGPYRPYAPDATSGLHFRYADAAGAPVSGSDPSRVARIDVVVRATTRGIVRLAGLPTDADGRRTDGDSISIALRNRP